MENSRINDYIFKDGDFVYYPNFGVGVFQVRFRDADNYPVVLEAMNETEYFTEYGRLYHEHEFPSIWLATPENREKLTVFYGSEFDAAPDPIEAKLPHLCIVADEEGAFEGISALRHVGRAGTALRVIAEVMSEDSKYVTEGGVRYKFAKLCKLHTDGTIEFVEY